MPKTKKEDLKDPVGDVPTQPPVDNDHVAEGAEKFDAPLPTAEQIVNSTIIDDAWKKIRSQYVFVKDPDTAKARRTGNILASQTFLPFTVFPLADNPDETLYWGGINGFFFSVVIGVEVALPQGIVDHITKSRIANGRILRSLKVMNPFTSQQVEVNLETASRETKARLGIY